MGIEDSDGPNLSGPRAAAAVVLAVIVIVLGSLRLPIGQILTAAPIVLALGGLCVVVMIALHGRRDERLYKKRVQANQCPQCGYDLRSCGDNCPECGMPAWRPHDLTPREDLKREEQGGGVDGRGKSE